MALPCMSCKAPLGLTLQFITKNPVCACPHCGVIFNFHVSDEVKQSLGKALHDIDTLKTKFKGMVKFG